MKFNQKKEKPKNDIHYYRVSSNEQVLGFSLDNQEKFCTEFSHKDGYAVFQAWREEGESAKTADRTKLKLMMRFAEQHKKQIARLVVYKVDRLSRKTEDYFALKAFFNKLGIIVVSATEKLEDTPGGKFYETLLSAAAEFDNNVRSQRTKEGMMARLMRGLWSGIAPWGYINTKDNSGAKIIAPHPEKSAIIRMVFEKYATGKYTHKELAAMANKLGQKSLHGKKISKQLVAKIVKNPIYCGRIVVPKFNISTMGTHEPIISEKLYYEANSENKGGNKPLRNKDNPDYPLRGIICGGCGKSISGGATTKVKGGKPYKYYGCVNPECKKRASIRKNDMEMSFTKFLRALTPNNDYFDALKEAIGLAHKVELQSVNLTEKRLEMRISEIKTRKDKLLDLRVDGKLSDDDFMPAHEKCKVQIAELEKEMSCLIAPELEIENIVNSGIGFLKSLPKSWEKLDVKDLRVLRPLLFPKNLVYDYPDIKTTEVCCIYNIKPGFLTEKTRLMTPRGIEPRFEP